MKRLTKALKKAAMYWLDSFAPYCVVGHSGKHHYCWTWAAALGWMKACNTRVMGGAVMVLDQWGNVIATQSMNELGGRV